MSRAVGAKGSDVYSTTGDARVDLSVRLVRGADADDLKARIQTVACENLADAYVMAFHSRNVRGGKGERDVFATLIEGLNETNPGLTQDVMDLVPHYGSWRDLFDLANTQPSLKSRILSLAAAQLKADAATPEGESISLCGKWAPRETSVYNVLAHNLATLLFPSEGRYSSTMKAYRKLVAGLNRRLVTVETLMCADRWDEIRPVAVPGRAGKLYSRAFLNLPSSHGASAEGEKSDVRCPDNAKRVACAEKFRAHFAAAAAGKATVHGSKTLFPHEVVKRARQEDLSEDERNQLRAVWRDMVTAARGAGGMGRSIFMSDFSGSMQSSGKTGDTPYWVSVALGILGSQTATGAFNGKLLTFDSNPTWHQFPESGDLFDCLATLAPHLAQGTSTDFQAAIDMVLDTLKRNRVRPGEEPQSIIVLTDMNWDQASASNGVGAYTGNRYRHHVKTEEWQTHLEMVQESFRRAGEDMWGAGCGWQVPRIIVWNLTADPTDLHAQADTPGVGFLSGWSPTQFKILQTEGPRAITPLELLRMELDDAQYDRVRARVASWIDAHRPCAGHSDGWGGDDA